MAADPYARLRSALAGLEWTIWLDDGYSRLLVCETQKPFLVTQENPGPYCPWGEIGKAPQVPDPYADQPLYRYASTLFTAAQLEEIWALQLIPDPKCMIMGRECTMHRAMGMFSDTSPGYQFAGQFMPSKPLTPLLHYILQIMSIATGGHVNSLLFNRYRNPDDYLSYHHDNDKYLTNIGVVALSFGASRRFQVRPRDKSKKREVTTIWTHDCQLIWMAGGNFQKMYEHGIPQEKNAIGERISATGRNHVG